MNDARGELLHTLKRVRNQTESLCASLATDDFGVQSMPDVSPPKWHLAHTSWFFENFLLSKKIPDYVPYHPNFSFIFNSYYKSVGDHLDRSRRGMLSRPTTDEIYRYRTLIDRNLENLPENAKEDPEIDQVLLLGLHHEQQHQELLLTDIKHNFWSNPLRPAYRSDSRKSIKFSRPHREDWYPIDEGLYEIGHDEQEFSFDNERPRHPVYLAEFSVSNKLVTNREYLEFIESGGYENSAHWLSAGWDLVLQNSWRAPLYWQRAEESSSGWRTMTLSGLGDLELDAPVVHVSYFEADAFARWRGARLPTEAEWEVYASRFPIDGTFLESEHYHPHDPNRVWGEVWQWTASSYSPYPGFEPFRGGLGEYNGKFMSNQMVLRGGSCVTPKDHIRLSYRNFFPPEARWQFSGIRLAR